MQIPEQLKSKSESEQNVIKHSSAFYKIYGTDRRDTTRYWIIGTFILFLIILFLPWTQNITGRGIVTTRRQEHRPQEMNAIIPGKIVKWYVKEGDRVLKGDTIVQLAEVKDNYLDPKLIERTKEQIVAKNSGLESYRNKVASTENQIETLEDIQTLKMRQLDNKIYQGRLKIIGDSADYVSSVNDYNIAKEQYRRQIIMKDSGLVSQVDLEKRNQYMQSTLAKKTSTQSKWINSKSELLNAKIELRQVEQEYDEKIFKLMGEKAAAESEIANSQGEISKLTNQYSNYQIRAGQYYLLAPQNGQVIDAIKAGINEMVKEGDKIVAIVPDKVQHAVEMFIKPVDMPLLHLGNSVRFIFDGFPAIIFSGWPEASIGTFGGQVVAIESAVSDNGKFRVLIAETSNDKPWPMELKIGTAASGIALLKDVPIWYELWRNINGFPPEYYLSGNQKNDKKTKK
ncbi:MAG: biotin/lipoyl-binding protein [Bacteroidota bacterium]|nr:biotin/lipoyl-binding protein [Bacteroidota bacterium]